MTGRFGSVVTAMVTPFRQDHALDLDRAQELASWLVDHGSDAVVVAGSTGESPTITHGEKSELFRAVGDAIRGRGKLICGTGTYSTAETLELTQAAEDADADGLLVVTPYYNKPPQSGLLAHFTAVADSTGLPVILYDIPGRTGVPIATETLVQLADHDRIVAVKDAKNDLYEGSWVMARTDLAFYSGADELNLAWLTHGGSGVVSVVGHVASERYAEMVTATDAGDLRTALGIHRRLLPAVRGIMTRTQGAIMAKAALQLTGVLAHRAVRLPLVEATAEQVEVLHADLEQADLL
jgi:4-hydroxy-tetrahydrodipicolinate synthase